MPADSRHRRYGTVRRCPAPSCPPRTRAGPHLRRRSSPTARSRTGAARSASRACSTPRSTTFLYHYWFRVEVEGIEHVPATGGALLVSNHAGALPPDAPMIAKAIKEEHPRPRPLHLTVEHFFKGYPGSAHADRQDRRRPRPPGQRAPPAVRRAAARARVPGGPQGHREALQGPLPAAALRPRRLRRGGDAGARADRPDRRASAPRRRCRRSPTSACSSA